MDEINLDFLKTPPRESQHAELTLSPTYYFDGKIGKKKCCTKRYKMAQTIAKVDELVREIDIYKSQNFELQQQLKDFQKTAQQVQQLYNEEKDKYSTVKHNFDKLQSEYYKIDVDLTNMSMVNEQIKARLAEYDGRPINFNNLVVKYVKIMNKLEGEDILKYCPDKDLVEKLREYCATMKLKIPPPNSPKKSKSRGNKIKTQENFAQCDILGEFSIQTHDYSRCQNKPEMQDQDTQYSVIKRDKASQYISTMITRQTNTEKIIQKHVQTMFPEPPAIDDILKVYSQWSTIRSVSPLLESPLRVNCTPYKEVLKTFSNAGTCTMLCNIRRKIDYLPLNNSSNIKQEIFTPSTSPTPTSYPTITNRSRISSLSNNMCGNVNPSSILDLFKSNTNLSLAQLPSNAFNELWQIFGKMLLSLLQNNNAGILYTNQTSTLNQQQFLDWLLEIYMNSQSQTTSTAQTQTMESTDAYVPTSPLCFNDSSVLLTNVLRPEPQKTFTEKTKEDGINVSLGSNSIDNLSTSPTHIAYTTNGPLQNISQEFNTIDRDVKQTEISSNDTEIPKTKNCWPNLNEMLQKNTSTNEQAKESKKTGTNHKILNQMQEFFPEIKINKKKLRVLKSLLNNKSKRKKSLEARNAIKKQSSSIFILNKNNINNTVETAVDFLKPFAVPQRDNQPFEENFSETEKMFLEQILNDNKTNCVPNTLKSQECTFIQSNNLPHSQPLSNTSRDASLKPHKKLKKSDALKEIKNKCQLLLNNSDCEFENQGMEIKNLEFNLKPVKPSNDGTNDNLWNYDEHDTQNWPIPVADGYKTCDQQGFGDVKCLKAKNSLVGKNLFQRTSATSTNISQQKTWLSNIPTENFGNSFGYNSCPEKKSKSDLPMSFFKDQEYIQISEIHQPENAKDNKYLIIDAKNSHNPSPKAYKYSITNTENSLRNDYKLSSNDDDAGRGKKEEGTFKIDGKVNKEVVTIRDITCANDMEQCIENRKSNNHDNETEIVAVDKFCATTDLTSFDDDRMDTHQATRPTYNSDFEKDFELSSSDNESLISENDFNATTGIRSTRMDSSEESKDIELSKEIFSSNFSSGSKKIPEKEKVGPKSIENFQYSTKSVEDVAKSEIEPKYDNIFIGNLEKEQLSIQNIEHKPLNQLNLSIESESGSISIARLGKQQGSINSLQYYEPKPKMELNLHSLQSNYKDENPKQAKEFKSVSNFNETKQQKVNALNNCKEIYKVFQSSSLNGFEDKSKHRLNQKEEKNLYEGNQMIISFVEKHKNDANTSKNSINFSEAREGNEHVTENGLNFTKNESTKESKNEENTLAWSVVTVSDSTLNHETLNSIELYKITKGISDNEVNSEILGLSNLSDLKNNTNKNNYRTTEGLKNENILNSLNDIGNIKIIEHSNIPQKNLVPDEEQETISFCSFSKLNTNKNKKEDNIKRLAYQRDLHKDNKNFEKEKMIKVDKEIVNISESKTGRENDAKCSQVAHEIYYFNDLVSNCSLSNINLLPNNEIRLCKSMDTVNENDLNDSFSTDNKLMIDEEQNENNSEHLESEHLNNNNSEILIESAENCEDTMNSSNISSILNSTLYSELLTESINPIVDELLKERLLTTPELKPKRGHKRKKESPTEVQPCKRSQRLKDKKMALQESYKLNNTLIEFSKYTKSRKNFNNNLKLKSPCEKDRKEKSLEKNYESTKILENENTIRMGFFRERGTEEEVTLEDNKIYTITKTPKREVTDDKTFKVFNDFEKCHKQESQLNLGLEQFKNSSKQEEAKQFDLNIECDQELEKSVSQKAIENFFIYSDSPQSPAPTEIHDTKPITPVVIPVERLPQFTLKGNKLTLFDQLISSYKNENHKQALKSVTSKECKRQENILKQFCGELKSYCYNEIELDLNYTSKCVINNLLSISPDYNLIQKAVIITAQNAEGISVPEKDLPSIIQEMPPRHLSKRLQCLFPFLKNIITRDDNFCKDLINKIESILFNSKQIENLSLQATLNLTQLYLMACKVQEYLQMPKHPARLFIAKCLYFYLQKSILMIHEILMWYPTVLPHREDKTYDRSDALISVIQQILMSTKYDMDKTDLRSKALLSKLRYEYHFEPFKPTLEEIINILLEKLKNSKFYNISLAFGVLCKRIGVTKTQHIVLNGHLLPLANDYYSLALKTNEYDKRIAVLLEIMSMLVKPLPLETDIQNYFNEFARFLNGFERHLIQEAALCSILRLQRFNVECCYNLLCHFQPTYDLNAHTQAMLKTFLYRRPLTFWTKLKSQNATNFNYV